MTILKQKILSKSFISAILLLVTLLLGIFKNYLWLPFSTGPGEIIIEKYNFLSLIALGYGLYFPLIVLIITMVLLLFSISELFISAIKIKSKFFTILTVIDIFSLAFPLILGLHIFNAGIACMLALLICNLILSFCHKI